MPEDGAKTEDEAHSPLFEIQACASNNSSAKLDQHNLEQNSEKYNTEEPFVVVSPIKQPGSSASGVSHPGSRDCVFDALLVKDSRIEHVENIHENDNVEDNGIHFELRSFSSKDSGSDVVILVSIVNVVLIPVEWVLV